MNGVPVYRMPAISVSASRKVEMARIEQEDQRARASDTTGSASEQSERTMHALRGSGN
jgi:hypothetical protein